MLSQVIHGSIARIVAKTASISVAMPEKSEEKAALAP
jgi:hypothetical protein